MRGPESGSQNPEIVKHPSIVDIITKVAPRLGITIKLESRWGRVGQLVTPDNRKFYFRGSNVDLNTLGAAEIARDKDYAYYFMRQMGYPVPEGKAFYSNRWCEIIGSDQNREAAYTCAQELGLPIIVKPNSKSQGMGVQKVEDIKDFYEAIDFVFDEVHDKVALVQEAVEGDDYRIVVLDNEVIAAYRRSPLSVIGDGQSTISELLLQKQETFNQAGRDTRIKMDDPRLLHKLQRKNLDFKSTIPHGQKINLLDAANLSSGGTAEDITEALHNSYRNVAVQLTSDMGLRFSGVDIITAAPIDHEITTYSVIEINAAPGLDYYTRVGVKQQQVVEALYEKILAALLIK